MRNRAQIIFLASWFASSLMALDVKPIGKDDLPKLKKQSCTLIHLWAAWCAPCIQELPNLLTELPTVERLTSVVIDVSPPKSQERDSKPLLERIAPKMSVYAKTAGDDDAFLNAMDPKWSGALPYSVLFDHGKQVKKWEGPINLIELRKAVAKSCRKS